MKKLIKYGISLFACSLLLIAFQSQAHHSFAAQYDATKPVTLQGYVTKVEWYNPHVYFYIDVENPETGEVENWGVEMGPPHMLQNRGWKKNDMQIGDELLVEATRARDGSTTSNARSVTMVATDKVLGAASSEQQTLTGGGNN
ncbi:DUF6152 family protein [Gammaproteobacteria bacterium]|nr:DUF6152 family protein [Gammaproteobacteria bacterium]